MQKIVKVFASRCSLRSLQKWIKSWLNYLRRKYFPKPEYLERLSSSEFSSDPLYQETMDYTYHKYMSLYSHYVCAVCGYAGWLTKDTVWNKKEKVRTAGMFVIVLSSEKCYCNKCYQLYKGDR